MEKSKGDGFFSQLIDPVADIVKHSIDVLGTPGFVLSILLVILLVLLLGFRWRNLTQSAQFTLILVVVLLLFGLAIAVVFKPAQSARTASDRTETRADLLLDVSSSTPLTYFQARFSTPVFDRSDDLLEGSFRGMTPTALRELRKARPSLQRRTIVFSGPELMLALVGLSDKSVLTDIAAYGVVFRSYTIPKVYLSSLAAEFETKQDIDKFLETARHLHQQAARRQEERREFLKKLTGSDARDYASRLKEEGLDRHPGLVFTTPFRPVVAVRNYVPDGTQTFVAYSQSSKLKLSEECKLDIIKNLFYSLESLMACNITNGTAFGFGKIFDSFVATSGYRRFEIDPLLIRGFTALEDSGFKLPPTSK